MQILPKRCFDHKRDGNPSLKCRYCDETFYTKSDVMYHQKLDHEEQIPICRAHVKGSCKFKSKCWFQHCEMSNTNESKTTDTGNVDNDVLDISKSEQSFEQ